MEARNAGKTQYAISLAVSLKKEVAPKAYKLRESLTTGSLATPGIQKFYHNVQG